MKSFMLVMSTDPHPAQGPCGRSVQFVGPAIVERAMFGAFAFLLFGFGLTVGEASAHRMSLSIDDETDEAPTYASVGPILNKHCVACHDDETRESGLSLLTLDDMQAGGERGPSVVPGSSDDSLLYRVLVGLSEPAMPPEDSEPLSDEEIQILREWIDAGAPGPDGQLMVPTELRVPTIAPAEVDSPITAMAWGPESNRLAVARFQTVEITDIATGQLLQQIDDLPGKVNSLRFANNDQWLTIGTGIAGLYGQALVVDVATAEIVARVQGHRDTLYAAVVSPDQRLLATAGYDRVIQLWSLETLEVVQTFSGHNHPVYDLDFSDDGTVLASASGDETIKLWNLETGERLDTLGQPLGEQYVVRMSPDGRMIVGAGADKRIRVWRFVSRETPRINPIRISRFAHEAAVTHLEFSDDGSRLVSVSEDRTIKIWETATWTQVAILDQQPDIVSAIAFTDRGRQLYVGRMDGGLERVEVGPVASGTVQAAPTEIEISWDPNESIHQFEESEPNDLVQAQSPLAVPATITGTLHSDAADADVDMFGFESRAGEQWVIECRANGSPLDSFIEVLDENGEPVLRVLLQAVRDSYFTFRGKDSTTSDDFRVHNWEEMELNEFLYAGGEVVKLWHYPRGPDSGFQVYPGRGSRHSFFDTTALAHALHAPCYIVEAYPPGTELIPTGLPVFPIYYENDDEAQRRMHVDSKLMFTAPRDGLYHVRVSDARGFDGEDYRYELKIRRPNPDFHVQLHGGNPTIAPGTGKEFNVQVERRDDFEGPITVEVEGLPNGFHCSSPLTIEAGQTMAIGVVWADSDAAAPPEGHAEQIKVTARAEIRGATIEHDVNSLGTIKLDTEPRLAVYLSPIDESASRQVTSADSLDPVNNDAGEQAIPNEQPTFELVLAPGETIAAHVRVERHGHQGPVSFGNADAGRNLPHGVYVDNIGLNGLLIVGGRNERTFFITAAEHVPESSRAFHLKANVAGGQCSIPVMLHIRNPQSDDAATD